jgi:hypothetical protein
MAENGEPGKNETAPPPKSTDSVSSSKGCICINSNPSGADILLNCKTTGKQTPATLTDLDPGSYTIGVTMEGCPTVSKDVTVKAGSPTTVCLTIMTAKNEKCIKIIVAWTFTIFILAVVIAILNRFTLLPVTDNLTKLIIYCACAGAIGGTTFSIYEVVSHLGTGDFDVAYFWWYIARPFIGLVYGTMILLFVAGGLMTLSGISAPMSPGLFDQKSVMFYIALSFLAGYAEEPVSLELKDLAEAIFKKPDRPDSQNGHN